MKEVIVLRWKGAEANALRTALRLTQTEFADTLGSSTRSVTRWATDPEYRISTASQRDLDTLFRRLDEYQLRLFVAALAATEKPVHASAVVLAAELALTQARIQELQQQLQAKEQQS